MKFKKKISLVNKTCFSESYTRKWVSDKVKALSTEELCLGYFVGQLQLAHYFPHFDIKKATFRSKVDSDLKVELPAIGLSFFKRDIIRFSLIKAIENALKLDDPEETVCDIRLSDFKSGDRIFVGINLRGVIGKYFKLNDSNIERISHMIIKNFGKGPMNPYYGLINPKEAPYLAVEAGTTFAETDPLFDDFAPTPSKEIIELFNQLNGIYNSIESMYRGDDY